MSERLYVYRCKTCGNGIGKPRPITEFRTAKKLRAKCPFCSEKHKRGSYTTTFELREEL